MIRRLTILASGSTRFEVLHSQPEYLIRRPSNPVLIIYLGVMPSTAAAGLLLVVVHKLACTVGKVVLSLRRS